MKLRIVLVTILVTFLAFVANAQTNEEKYKTAENMIDLFQFEEAINLLQELSEAEPENDLYYKELGYCYLSLLDFDNAKIYFGKSIELNPDCIKCYSHLARAYYETGLYDEAEAIIAKGFELSDTTAHLYMNRGLIYMAQQKMDEAMFDFTKAVQLDPENTDYLITRANFYIMTNQAHFAYSDISDAIKLEPEVSEYYYYRAYILLNLNLLDEALIDINKAISINNEVADYHNLQFSIYFSMYDYEMAEKSIMRSLEIVPDSHMTYINLADLYFQSNRIDEYCTANHKALSLIPEEHLSEFEELQKTTDKYCNDTRMPYYFVRGLNLYNSGEYNNAVKFLISGLDKVGKSSVLENLLASSYIAIGEYEKAEEYFTKSYDNRELLPAEVEDFYSIDLTDADIQYVANSYIVKSDFGMAMLLLRKLEIPEAMRRADVATKMAEDMEGFDGKEFVYNLKALIHIYNGNFESAKEQLEIAKQKNPYYQQTYINEAIIKLLQACKFKTKDINFVFSVRDNNMRLVLPKLKFIKGQENLLEEVITICNTSISQDPDNAYAYLVKAKALQLKKDEACKQAADKAVELGIDNAYEELHLKK